MRNLSSLGWCLKWQFKLFQYSCLFFGYQAGDGGAISANFAQLTIDNTVFAQNVADKTGGALQASRPLVVTNTVFDSNTVTKGTGGAAIVYDKASFSNCTFAKNSCLAYGGAICGQEKSSIFISNNSVFQSNIAGFSGGAIFTYSEMKALDISDSTSFINSTSSCCYVASGLKLTSSASCIDIDGSTGDVLECCSKGYYTNGEHCKLCTDELTCSGVVGANISTLQVASGLWRTSSTTLRTYQCYNSAACSGGVAITNTNGYCATGYKGPCKCYYVLITSEHYYRHCDV
jgi:predicted outer membrane repeat protein